MPCCSAASDRCLWREGCGSFAKAETTARVVVPTTVLLSVSTIVVLERGPYSCLVMMKMKHTHTCRQAPIACTLPASYETAAKLLGLGHRGWAKPKQDGRVRFIGAADRHHHGPVHRGRRHETSGAGLATAREVLLHFYREPLVHREHRSGADRTTGLALGCENKGSCIGCC